MHSYLCKILAMKKKRVGPLGDGPGVVWGREKPRRGVGVLGGLAKVWGLSGKAYTNSLKLRVIALNCFKPMIGGLGSAQILHAGRAI